MQPGVEDEREEAPLDPEVAANIAQAFESSEWDQNKPATTISIALKAWLSAWIATIGDMEEKLSGVRRVNLVKINWPDEVSFVFHQTTRAECLLRVIAVTEIVPSDAVGRH